MADPIQEVMASEAFRRGDPAAVSQFEKLQQSKWGFSEIAPDQVTPDPEQLTPELRAAKERYQQTNGDPQQPGQQSGAQPAALGPDWSLTPEQADEQLKREWGYWHPENMVEVQNPENFRAVFGDFLRTDQDRQFLNELFTIIGHHPAGLRLYRHLIGLVKRGS
jgi:hypothetical protein